MALLVAPWLVYFAGRDAEADALAPLLWAAVR
jgi:hypothetical protein